MSEGGEGADRRVIKARSKEIEGDLEITTVQEEIIEF